jgi:hypothetical protein
MWMIKKHPRDIEVDTDMDVGMEVALGLILVLGVGVGPTGWRRKSTLSTRLPT